MLELNTGTQGAKRSRYYPDSPDALLRKIVERNPEANETEVEEAFEAEAVKFGGEIISAIIAYWFANRYRALMRENMPIVVRRQRRAAAEREIADRVREVKKAAVATIVRTLLDKVAPACGKHVRDMTKRDCEREGGWYLHLANKLKRGQTVAQASITDEDLWKLYNS